MAKPVLLSDGDFVVLPRGAAHLMRDARTTPAADFFDLIKRSAPNARKLFRAGGSGAVTRLVCGGMRFGNGATDPLLANLPPLIVVKRRTARPALWLQAIVAQILEELESDRSGAEAVVTRLADILFIQAVRAYFEDNTDGAKSGRLAAARDKHIGQALALLHAEPEKH